MKRDALFIMLLILFLGGLLGYVIIFHDGKLREINRRMEQRRTMIQDKTHATDTTQVPQKSNKKQGDEAPPTHPAH